MAITREIVQRHRWIIGYAILVTFGVVFRFFNSTVLGVFFLSVALYFAVATIGWGDPFSLAELIAWFDNLEDSDRAVIFSSLLTVVGFLIAFQIATKNWKDQMAASVALEISREIETFFREASGLLIKSMTLVDYLLESEAIVKEANDPDEVKFRIGYILDQKTEFMDVRARLVEMSVQSHTKFGDRFVALSSYWGVIPKLVASIQAFVEIVDRIWFLWPSVKPVGPDAREAFLNQLEPEKCREFIRIHQDNFNAMNAMSSSATSSLASAVIRPNLSFLITFLYALKWAPIVIDARKKSKYLFRKYVSEE